MSGIFQDIDPQPPHRPGDGCCGGEDTLAGRRGGGVNISNILEDARHSSVLYMCKYFVCVLLSHIAYLPSSLCKTNKIQSPNL
jgi:hypothetical protein